MNNSYYIGIMSGTSLDGIDCVIADFSKHEHKIIASASYEYPVKVKNIIKEIHASNYKMSLSQFGEINYTLGVEYANCVDKVLASHNIQAQQIKAIGCHGQTIFHAPNSIAPFTLQVGCGAVIANQTNINTINDFRSKDIAAGGQGAPFAPAFHQKFFAHAKKMCVILNLGGIANITCLQNNKDNERNKRIQALDTGPANILLNQWIFKHKSLEFDDNGNWGESGKIIPFLLEKLLLDPYFKKSSPKSTGTEYFNLQWLEEHLTGHELPQDVQATLHELTAISITDQIKKHQPHTKAIYTCGGGAENKFLISRIQQHVPNIIIKSVGDLGMSPKWVEATCFAWLAYCFDNDISVDLMSVTGSSKANILGSLHKA